MVVCLRPDDVACSDNYFFGRAHVEHITALIVGALGCLGAAGVLAAAYLAARTLLRRPAS
jgi:hypothetical protein